MIFLPVKEERKEGEGNYANLKKKRERRERGEGERASIFAFPNLRPRRVKRREGEGERRNEKRTPNTNFEIFCGEDLKLGRKCAKRKKGAENSRPKKGSRFPRKKTTLLFTAIAKKKEILEARKSSRMHNERGKVILSMGWMG